jgi:peptidyl-prolyl cis-trans isomerase A (cyclophilin A)
MMIRLTAMALLMLAAPSLAQTAPPDAAATPAAVAVPKPATVRVSLLTSEGPIVLELEKERAPITTANFLHYVDMKRFDGMTFYRAVKVPNAPELGLVQGGVHYDPRRMFPPIMHEPTSKTGILHTDGTISMARRAPGTATGDFFITIGSMAYMNADPTQPGDNQGYAAFGHVVEGMEIVRHMLSEPTSPTQGEGVMKGQFLAAPVKIISARRVK